MARPIPQLEKKLNEDLCKLSETIKPKGSRSFVDLTVETIKDKSTKNLVLGTISARPGRPSPGVPRPAVIPRPEPCRPDKPLEYINPPAPFPPMIAPSPIPNPSPSVTANKLDTSTPHNYHGLTNKIPGFSAFHRVQTATRYPSPIHPSLSNYQPNQPLTCNFPKIPTATQPPTSDCPFIQSSTSSAIQMPAVQPQTLNYLTEQPNTSIYPIVPTIVERPPLSDYPFIQSSTYMCSTIQTPAVQPQTLNYLTEHPKTSVYPIVPTIVEQPPISAYPFIQPSTSMYSTIQTPAIQPQTLNYLIEQPKTSTYPNVPTKVEQSTSDYPIIKPPTTVNSTSEHPKTFTHPIVPTIVVQPPPSNNLIIQPPTSNHPFVQLSTSKYSTIQPPTKQPQDLNYTVQPASANHLTVQSTSMSSTIQTPAVQPQTLNYLPEQQKTATCSNVATNVKQSTTSDYPIIKPPTTMNSTIETPAVQAQTLNNSKNFEQPTTSHYPNTQLSTSMYTTIQTPAVHKLKYLTEQPRKSTYPIVATIVEQPPSSKNLIIQPPTSNYPFVQLSTSKYSTIQPQAKQPQDFNYNGQPASPNHLTVQSINNNATVQRQAQTSTSNYTNPADTMPTSIFCDPVERPVVQTLNYPIAIRPPPTSIYTNPTELTPTSCYESPIQPPSCNYTNSMQPNSSPICLNTSETFLASSYGNANIIQDKTQSSNFTNLTESPQSSNYLNNINSITSNHPTHVQLAPTSIYLKPSQPSASSNLNLIDPSLAPDLGFQNPGQNQLAHTLIYMSPIQSTSDYQNHIQTPTSSCSKPTEQAQAPIPDQPTKTFSNTLETVRQQPTSGYPNIVQQQITSGYPNPIQQQPISDYPNPSQQQPTSGYPNPNQQQPTSGYLYLVQQQPTSSYLNAVQQLPTSGHPNTLQQQATSGYLNTVPQQTTPGFPNPVQQQPYSGYPNPIQLTVPPIPNYPNPYQLLPEPTSIYQNHTQLSLALTLNDSDLDVRIPVTTMTNLLKSPDEPEMTALETVIEQDKTDDEQRIEAENIEALRRAADRMEEKRLEANRIEAEKIQEYRTKANRIEKKRLEEEQIIALRLEAKRLELDRAEAERIETHKIEACRRMANRIEMCKKEAEQIEAYIKDAKKNFDDVIEQQDFEDHIDKKIISSPVIRHDNRIQPLKLMLNTTSISHGSGTTVAVSTQSNEDLTQKNTERHCLETSLPISKINMKSAGTSVDNDVNQSQEEIPTIHARIQIEAIESTRMEIQSNITINLGSREPEVEKDLSVTLTTQGNSNSKLLNAAEANKQDQKAADNNLSIVSLKETNNNHVTVCSDNNNKNMTSFQATAPTSVLNTTESSYKSEVENLKDERTVAFSQIVRNVFFKIPETKRKSSSRSSRLAQNIQRVNNPNKTITKSIFAPVVMSNSDLQNNMQYFLNTPPNGGYINKHNQQYPQEVIKRTDFQSKNMQEPSRLSSQNQESKGEVVETSSQVVALKRTHQDNFDENDFENLITENQIYGNKIIVKEKSKVKQQEESKITTQIETTLPEYKNIVKPNFMLMSNVQYPTNLMMIKKNIYSNDRQVCQTTNSVTMHVSFNEERSNGMNFVKNIIQETNTMIVKHANEQSLALNKEILVCKSSNNVLQTLSNNNSKTEVDFQTSQKKVIMTPFIHPVPRGAAQAEKKQNHNQCVTKEPNVVPVLIPNKEIRKQVEMKNQKTFSREETKQDQQKFGEVRKNADQRILHVKSKPDKKRDVIVAKPEKLIICTVDTKLKPKIVITNLNPKLASKVEEVSILDIYEKRKRLSRQKHLSNTNKESKTEKKNGTKTSMTVITPDKMKYEIFKEMKSNAMLAESSDSENDFREDELSEYESIIDKFGQHYNENAKLDFLAGFSLASKEVFREKELDRHERTMKCDSVASAYMAAGLNLMPEDKADTPQAKQTSPEPENKWTKQKKHLFLASFKLVQVSPWYKAEYEKSWREILRERSRRNGLANPPSPDPIDPDGHLHMLTEINKSVNENNNLIKKRLDSIHNENSDIRVLAEKNFSELNKLSKMADRSVKLFSRKDSKKRDSTPGNDSENIKKHKEEPKKYHRLNIPGMSKIISLKTVEELTPVSSTPATSMDEPANSAKCGRVETANTRDVACQVEEWLLWPGNDVFIKSYKEYDLACKKEIQDLQRCNTRLQVESAQATRAAARDKERARALLAERQRLAKDEGSLRKSLDRLTKAIESIRKS